jgi:hypothetical protein
MVSSHSPRDIKLEILTFCLGNEPPSYSMFLLRLGRWKCEGVMEDSRGMKVFIKYNDSHRKTSMISGI